MRRDAIVVHFEVMPEVVGDDVIAKAELKLARETTEHHEPTLQP